MKEAFSRIETLKSFLSQILSFKTFRVIANLESAKQDEVLREAFSRIETLKSYLSQILSFKTFRAVI